MSATSTPEAVALHFASQCDRGKVREENQDSVLRCAVPLGDLMVVADGIGGYEGGAVASRMAVEAISASLESMPTFFPIDIAIEEAACRANAEIVAAAAEPDTPNNRMGTTVVLAILQQDPGSVRVQASIGHIGDSRAYLLHNRRLTRITRDHSAIQLLLDHNLIAPEQARNHPDASVLTRTLGHEPSVKIDLNTVTLEPSDTLLLCSDGLWGYVSEEDIERVLADIELTAEQASRALLDLALDAGGYDNVGIQLARLAGTGHALAPRDPAPAFESQPHPELSLACLLNPDPSAAPALRLEIAPPVQSEAAPVAASAAPITEAITSPALEPALEQDLKPNLGLNLEPEILPASEPEPPSAPEAQLAAAIPIHAGIELNPALAFTLEPNLELQVPAEPVVAEQVPAEQAFAEQAVERQILAEQALAEGIHAEQALNQQALNQQILDRQPAPVSAPAPESLSSPEGPEPRLTTLRGVLADLWEMFVYPLGRDFDFAPEWHIVWASVYETFGEKEARPEPLTFRTRLASFFVARAASPKPGLEMFPLQAPDPAVRFRYFPPQVVMLLKSLGILLLAFCTSCGLVYCALLQNWFGIDRILR